MKLSRCCQFLKDERRPGAAAMQRPSVEPVKKA
jgi:hypothetical protein